MIDEMLSDVAAELVRELGADLVTTDAEEMRPFCRDWHGDVEGIALAVIRPRTTDDVVKVVRLCGRLGLNIVPQGGNTGLVLGATPESEGQVVVSLGRMNRIRTIDAENFSAVVEAGCILSVVKDAVAAEGMFFPLTLGAQGSCQIGGNVSSNAGGINVLRYGMTRELVLGLEVVLPDGEVWSQLSPLRKDNRGIDLKHLFIGAEGTLGIVTAVSLKLAPLPTQKSTALLAVESLEQAVALYRFARTQCCDLLSAFEFMPPEAFGLAKEALPHLELPMAGDHPAYVLMEISGAGLVDISNLMQRFLELCFEQSHLVYGVVASSDSQARTLWLFREGMVEGQAKRGLHLRTDVSVPISRLPSFVSDVEHAVLAELPDAFCIAYGHVGDGNVHFNIHAPKEMEVEHRRAYLLRAKHVIDAAVTRYDGSISAEHGIGRLKQPEFEKLTSPVHLHLLSTVKQAIDPAKLMNNGVQIKATALDRASCSVIA